MPIVSVIVPNYNHAPYLRQRIDSILNQTFQDFELILLDDASADDSREILETYRHNPHVTHVVYNDNNSGSPFAQWARGIALARGEWVWIAESDDYAEPNFLSAMLKKSAICPTCSIISSVPIYTFADGREWSASHDALCGVISGAALVRQHLSVGNFLTNVSALLLRRSALTSTDTRGITTFRLCGDWLLYAMLCQQGDVYITNIRSSHFRQHTNNTSLSAEACGTNLIEGAAVLQYMCNTFDLHPRAYARSWGRMWAKQERRHEFDKHTSQAVAKALRPFPSIILWHSIYRIRTAI